MEERRKEEEEEQTKKFEELLQDEEFVKLAGEVHRLLELLTLSVYQAPCPQGPAASSSSHQKREEEEEEEEACEGLLFPSYSEVWALFNEPLSGSFCSVFIHQFLGFWTFPAIIYVKVDTASERDHRKSGHHFSSLFWQLVARGLGRPRSTGWILLGDDFVEMSGIQRLWLDSGFTITCQSQELN